MSTHTTRATKRQQLAEEQRRRAEAAQRRRRLLVAGTAVGTVLLVIVVLVVAKLAGVGSGPGPTAAATGDASRVAAAVTSVPASTLDKVGVGTAQAAPLPISAPPLRAAGKPRVLYVGAEYCPFCAAQRWPVVVALSRFGTFSGLGLTHSASQDVYPDTPTLTFHGSSYSSRYLSFTGVETSTNKPAGNGYQPLDSLTAADQKTFTTYDRPPYVKGSSGAIPFIDIAGAYVSSGASIDPSLLAGMTQQQVAQALHDASSPVARAVDGSANLITAALCRTTGGSPGTVCQASGVKAAAAALPAQ